MKLRNGESTRDDLGHKFADGLALYLWAGMMDGDRGDAEASDEFGNWCESYGRRVLAGDDQGFVWCDTYETAAMARAYVETVEHNFHAVTCEDCDTEYAFYEDETCPRCEESHTGPLVGSTVNLRGIAARVVQDYDDGRLVVVWVGDNARQWADRDEVPALTDDDYCAECGQIGCTADGR